MSEAREPTEQQLREEQALNGCPTCKKQINTLNQFLHHLADDVMPALIEKLSEARPE